MKTKYLLFEMLFKYTRFLLPRLANAIRFPTFLLFYPKKLFRIIISSLIKISIGRGSLAGYISAKKLWKYYFTNNFFELVTFFSIFVEKFIILKSNLYARLNSYPVSIFPNGVLSEKKYNLFKHEKCTKDFWSLIAIHSLRNTR